MKCELDELKMFLSGNLVAYKVPEHIRFVDDFIRTAVGKVPKNQLAEDMIKWLNK
jgi:non-ribosomal peptide synthetase component E (peptide arylation enzyme)